jgi:hypothetical protein
MNEIGKTFGGMGTSCCWFVGVLVCEQRKHNAKRTQKQSKAKRSEATRRDATRREAG